MSTGKRETIMICCVTFEVAKVVDPVEYYGATKVHILNTSKEGDIYGEFYEEVCKQIHEKSPKTEIIPHRSVIGKNGEFEGFTVFDFTSTLSEILRIILEEKEKYDMLDIYINTSAGTSEYSAASVIASMMDSNCIPFTISADSYTVSSDMVKKIYYENNKPVGQTKTTKEPCEIKPFKINIPDKNKVLAFKIFEEKIRDNNSSASAVMEELMGNEELKEKFNKGSGKFLQKDVMKYQRNYIDYWLKAKWLDKESKRKYVITEEGYRILEIFGKAYSKDKE